MTDERDPKVSRRYRELGAEEPPTELDAGILAASRRAAETRLAPLVPPTGRRRPRRRRRHGRLTRRETWNSLNLKRGPGRMRKLRGLPCGERSGALWRKRPSAFSSVSRSCADKESRTRRTRRLRNSGVAIRTTGSRRRCGRKSRDLRLNQGQTTFSPRQR